MLTWTWSWRIGADKHMNLVTKESFRTRTMTSNNIHNVLECWIDVVSSVHGLTHLMKSGSVVVWTADATDILIQRIIVAHVNCACVHACACVCVCVCVVIVCRGTTQGLTHSKNIDATYRQYNATYYGCTYVDGNVEIVFLTNRTNYDLSFLKVSHTDCRNPPSTRSTVVAYVMVTYDVVHTYRPIFERSYGDFMILSHDKVMTTDNVRLHVRLFQQNVNINKHKHVAFARSRK